MMQSVSSDRIDLPPPLAGGDIHVWLLAVEGAPNHRVSSGRARELLERLLAGYAGLDSAPDIVRGKHGKPHAPALPDIDFNVSHTRAHVAIAFARGQPLGVDIESMDRRIEALDIARRYFAASEAAALEALPASERTAAFLRLWTAKEAVLKALGAGLHFGLDRLRFALDPTGRPTQVTEIAAEAGDASIWRFALFEPTPDLVGAVAWHGPPRAIRTFASLDDA